MLLKDAAKMIHEKFDEEFPKLRTSDMTRFRISSLRVSQGYILAVSVNGKTVAIISSKREDKRIFKTLDAIKRALDGVGIDRFEVIGTK